MWGGDVLGGDEVFGVGRCCVGDREEGVRHGRL